MHVLTLRGYFSLLLLVFFFFFFILLGVLFSRQANLNSLSLSVSLCLSLSREHRILFRVLRSHAEPRARALSYPHVATRCYCFSRIYKCFCSPAIECRMASIESYREKIRERQAIFPHNFGLFSVPYSLRRLAVVLRSLCLPCNDGAARLYCYISIVERESITPEGDTIARTDLEARVTKC